MKGTAQEKTRALEIFSALGSTAAVAAAVVAAIELSVPAILFAAAASGVAVAGKVASSRVRSDINRHSHFQKMQQVTRKRYLESHKN
jgi:hypothetical protein